MTYARHDTLPMVRTSNARLAIMLAKAMQSGISAMLLGSSLHTAGGAGGQFASWFNYAAACAYGQSPMTPWMPVLDLVTNNTSLNAQWGAESAAYTSAMPNGISLGSGTVESNGEQYIDHAVPNFPIKKACYGTPCFTVMFEPDCGSVVPGADAVPCNFFPVGASDRYRIEMILHGQGGLGTETTNGNLWSWSAYKCAGYKPVNINYPGGTELVTKISQIVPGYPSSVNGSTPTSILTYLASDDVGTPYKLAIDSANPYVQIRAFYSASQYFLSAMRLRLIEGTSPRGMVMSLAGAGGWGSGNLLTRHPKVGMTIAAMAPDIIFVAYHCNSAYIYNSTPDQYYADIKAICQHIRATNPNACIVLAGDHYRYDSGYDATKEDNHSRYTGADFALVDQGYADAALNTHYACDLAGRSVANTAPDGLAWKGSWVVSTAYSVGDVVATPSVAAPRRFFRCVQAHTSSANDQPGLFKTNAPTYWKAWFLDGSSDDVTTYNPITSGDIIHLSPIGQKIEATIWWNLLQQAGIDASSRFVQGTFRDAVRRY